jgi:hypothetical protein
MTPLARHEFPKSCAVAHTAPPVPSGLAEALDRIDQLNDRVSKLTDISFRELTRLGERVGDLSQLAHQHLTMPENGESAKE